MKKAIFLLGVLMFILSLHAHAIPQQINFQGRLVSSDATPITSNVSVTFNLYDDVTSGNKISTETISVTPNSNGAFSVLLGFNPSTFDESDRWIEVQVQSETLSPRSRIVSVPYAYRAITAESLSGAGAGAYVLRGGDKMSGSLTLEGSANLLVNGKIGIGTTEPVAKLDVNGTAKIAKVLTEAKTSLTTTDFGKTITAAGAQTITLPDISATDIGATFTIVKLGTDTVTIDAVGSDVIAGSTAGGGICNNSAAETFANITIQVAADNKWIIVGGHGTWTTF